MDSQQQVRMQTMQFKSELNSSSTNWKKSKHPMKSSLSHQNSQLLNTSKGALRETKQDWKNVTNSNWKNTTQTNWKNTSQTNWKNTSQSQWKTNQNGRGSLNSNRRGESSVEKIEDQPNMVTLDQYLGIGFKPLPLNEIGSSEFEGASPPLVDLSEQQYLNEEFEINETDEDMYSESNTYSQHELESQKKPRRKQKSKVQQREKSLEAEMTILVGEAKIKQKIIDKYSKNPKSKHYLPSDKKVQLEPTSKQESSLEYIKLPAASPKVQTKGQMFPYTEGIRRNQCNSQSPLRNGEVSVKLDFLVQRGSLTNFGGGNPKHLPLKSYDDSKQVENHIAFRNSFYANQKYHDVLDTHPIKGKNCIVKPGARFHDDERLDRVNPKKDIHSRRMNTPSIHLRDGIQL